MAASFGTCAGPAVPYLCRACGHGGASVSRLSLLPPQCLLSVTSSPAAPVGKYTLNVKAGTSTYKPQNSAVYLLFNPWCEGEWSHSRE